VILEFLILGFPKITSERPLGSLTIGVSGHRKHLALGTKKEVDN